MSTPDAASPPGVDPVSFALSPDGRQVVFVAAGGGAPTRLTAADTAGTYLPAEAGRDGEWLLWTRAGTLQALPSAVNARTHRATVASIAAAEERDRLLSAIARNEHVEPGVRIRAITELNRCSGRHSVKHIHEHNYPFSGEGFPVSAGEWDR